MSIEKLFKELIKKFPTLEIEDLYKMKELSSLMCHIPNAIKAKSIAKHIKYIIEVIKKM